MPRIDKSINKLRGRRHRAGESGGDLPNGHLLARAQLEQHLHLCGCQAKGIAEIGDGREERFGDDRQQLHASLDERLIGSAA